MASDDRYALAAITAVNLANVLQGVAALLPLTQSQGQAVKRTIFAVSYVMAPGITAPADVAAISSQLTAAVATIQAASAPTDATAVFYNAASSSAAAVPSFASPARTAEAALGRLLAECLEATWLGQAFVSEAQTDFGDTQSAIAARARIAAAMDGSIDRIAAAGCGQKVIGILGQVARTATDHIATVAADLRPIVRVGTARSAPSTAIAFGLYGDPSQAPDLVSRNKVATPLFMPTTLEALAPSS